MTKADLEKKIRNNAGNLVYMFIPDSWQPYFSNRPKMWQILMYKKELQIKYVKGLCLTAVGGVGQEEVNNWIVDEVKKVYAPITNPSTGKKQAATPELILVALANGQTVKGMNWKAGIYGIGNTTATGNTFDAGVDIGGQAGLTVNPNTGTIPQLVNSGPQLVTVPEFNFEESITMPATIATYDSDKGITYTSKLTESGLYVPDTISNGTDIISSSGKTKTKLDATFWNNLTNTLGQIQELVNGFAQKLSGITATSLTPMQIADGWIEPEKKDNSVLSSSTGLILGGSLIASAILLSQNPPTRGRKK